MSNRTLSAFGPEQVAGMLERFHVPGVDVRAILEDQRKNVEALSRATRMAEDGASAVTQKQAEILGEAMRQAVAMMRDFRMKGNPSEAAKVQQDLFRQALETGLESARELAELVSRSNREAFSVIEHRMRESMAEIRESARGFGTA